MKIVFDASIHLGQFCLRSEEIRIACKNSQISISTKPGYEIVGVVSFNEISWIDHIIWGLERTQQDTFYPFMDLFHSVKNIDRIPLNKPASVLALQLVEKLNLRSSNAMTCAIAILSDADLIHTFYPDLLRKEVKSYMKNEHTIEVVQPESKVELNYAESGLEASYQAAREKFLQDKVDIYDSLLVASQIT
ncbi:MAG: DUF6190 family protein [Patescibacteria group bacterium]